MPKRTTQTTITIDFNVKDALERHWNDAEHTSWDDFMRDVVKMIKENELQA